VGALGQRYDNHVEYLKGIVGNGYEQHMSSLVMEFTINEWGETVFVPLKISHQ